MSRLVRSDSRESVFSVSSCVSGVGGWQVGDRARMSERSGTISFIGPTKFAPGEWVGLVLDEPMGKNDGSVNGYRYFSCTPNHGLFVKSSKLERIVMSPARLFKSPTPGEFTSKHATEFGFDIGDRVITGGKVGTLRFLGETEFAPGVWAGVELDQPLGKNDGSVKGKRYFTCKPMFGVFASAGKTQRAPTQCPSQVPVHHNKASILRTEKGKRHGSHESLNSIGRSSIASSRFGMGRPTGRSTMAHNIAENSTIKALQNALEEKEKHIEQLMAERELEKNDYAPLASGTDSEELLKKLEDKLKTSEGKAQELKAELAAKKKEIEDLHFQLEEEGVSKQCEIEELQQKFMTMSQSYSNDDDDGKEKLSSELAKLKEALCAQKERIEQLEEEAANSVSTTNALQETRCDNDRLLAELTELKSKFEKEKKEYEKTQKLMQEQIEELKSQLTKAQAGCDESSELNMQIEKMRHDLAATVAELDSCRDELLTQQNVGEELRQSLDKASAEIAEYDSLLRNTSSEHSKIKEELEKAVNDARSASEERVRSLEEELSRTQIALEEQHQMVSSLSTQQGSATSALQERIVALERERNSEAAKVEEISAEKDGIQNSLAETSHELSAVKKQLEQSVKNVEENEQEYKDQLAKVQDELKYVQQLEKELKLELEHKDNNLATQDIEITSLKRQLENEKVASDTLKSQQIAFDSEIKTLNENLAESLSKMSQLENCGRNMEEQFKMKQLELQSQLEEATLKATTTAEKLDAAKKEHEALASTKNKMQDTVAELNAEVLSLKITLKQLGDQRDTDRTTLNRMQEDLGQCEDKCTGLSLELTRKSELVELITGERDGLQKQLRAAQDSYTALQSSLESLKLGENSLAKDLTAAKEESSNRLAEVETLREQIDKIKLELELAKNQLDEAKRDENRLNVKVREAEDNAAEKIKELERSLTEETSMRSKLEKEILIKDKENVDLRHELDRIYASTEETSSKLVALIAEKKENDSRIEELLTNLTVSNNCVTKLEGEVAALREEIDQKTADLDTVIISKLAAEEAVKEMTTFKNRCQELENELHEANATSLSLKSENEKFEKEGIEHKLAIDTVEQELSTTKGQLQQLMETIKEKDASEQSLKALLAEKDTEISHLVSTIDVEKGKYDADIKAANEEKIQLRNEIRLNVEDLQKLKTESQESASKNSDAASSLQQRYELLEAEMRVHMETAVDDKNKINELTATLNAFAIEKSALELERKKDFENIENENKSIQDQLQNLQSEVSLLKEREIKLTEDIAEHQLKASLYEIQLEEGRKTAEQKSSALIEKLRIVEEELTLKTTQLCEATKVHTDGGIQSAQMASEFAEAMKKIKILSEEKNILSNEYESMRERISQQEVELLRMKGVEAESKVETAKALQKMELFNEIEASLMKKNVELAEKNSELMDRLEDLRGQTENDQIRELSQNIDFLHGIIATKTREVEQMKRELERLREPAAQVFNKEKKEKKPMRLYCDMCEQFDLHETVDCPMQAMEAAEVASHSHHATSPEGKKVKPPPREYCDHCEEFGHDTTRCEKHQKKKHDYTF